MRLTSVERNCNDTIEEAKEWGSAHSTFMPVVSILLILSGVSLVVNGFTGVARAAWNNHCDDPLDCKISVYFHTPNNAEQKGDPCPKDAASNLECSQHACVQRKDPVDNNAYNCNHFTHKEAYELHKNFQSYYRNASCNQPILYNCHCYPIDGQDVWLATGAWKQCVTCDYMK